MLRDWLIGLEVAEAIVIGLGIEVQVGLFGLAGRLGHGQLGRRRRCCVRGMPGHSPGRSLRVAGRPAELPAET